LSPDNRAEVALHERDISRFDRDVRLDERRSVVIPSPAIARTRPAF